MADKTLPQYDDIPVLDPADWLYIFDRETGKSFKVQAGALAALAGPVTKVNEKTGAVTLSTDDLSDAGKTNKYVTQAEKDKIAKIETTGDGTKVLANNGQYIVVSTSGGGGTGIFAPVADLTALKNIDTTSASDWPDKWAVYVESLKVFYALDRESTATADDDQVVAPSAGFGRWMRNTLPIATAEKPGLARAGDPQLLDELVERNNETVNSTTGIINDLATPTGTIRFTGTAAVSVSGLAGGADGRDMLFINETAFDLTLMHQNAGSAAGNRMIIQGGDNVYIRSGGAARFRYSASESAWQMTDLWGSEYFPTLKGATTRTMQVTPTGYAQAEENIELNTVLVNQSADFDKATLNANYPDYVAGQRIMCPNLTNGGKIYEKYDDSTNDWISYPVTVVL
jgi:hypothetical protein